eukprot:gene40014-49473_t
MSDHFLSLLFMDLAVQERSELEYYEFMYPMELLNSTLEATNQSMLAKYPSAKLLDAYELQKYHGIRMAMIADPREGPTSNYWRTPSNARLQDTIFQAADYGKRICVDESMSKWTGREAEYDVDGIPHL